jgi:hypothetical protein
VKIRRLKLKGSKQKVKTGVLEASSNLVKETMGNLNADSHIVLNKWKNHICQLLNVHGVNEVRQDEIHSAKPLVPESSAFALDMAAEKLER